MTVVNVAMVLAEVTMANVAIIENSPMPGRYFAYFLDTEGASHRARRRAGVGGDELTRRMIKWLTGG